MRQLKSIAFTGMLALLMGGCASGDEEVVVSPSPSPAVSPSPAATTPPQAQPFGAQKPPVVAQKPRVAAPALIQPTNADARTQQVSQGRQDPFALLPLPLVPVPPPPGSQPPAPQPVPQVRSVPNTTGTTGTTGARTGGGAGATAGRRPNTVAGGSGAAGRPNATAGRPNTTGRPGATAAGQAGSPAAIRPGRLVQPTVPSIAALPPLPQPTLAQSVEVSGVIQVGNEARAIVKAPNEATSRYVTAGQRLSNGQILVKRIEMNSGSEPVVVLEQYGIEVGKRVGDKPAQPAGGNPTA